MSDLVTWPRRNHSAGGGLPSVLWVVFGQFKPLRLDSATYRTAGLPLGMEKVPYLKGEEGFPDFVFRNTWEEVGLNEHPGVLDRARRAPEAIVLRGSARDDGTLDYLRDLVGLTTCLLDRGGIAVVDVMAFKWWSPDAFRHQLFLPRRPMPYQHVSILQSKQPDGRWWLHTRGMRLFGRPDFSVPNLLDDGVDAAVEVVNELIGRLAQGEVLRDGAVSILALPNVRASVHHRGSLDDPAFNNVFIEVVL